jgi:hypothetical protein
LLVIGGDQAGSFELFDPVTGSNPLSLQAKANVVVSAQE